MAIFVRNRRLSRKRYEIGHNGSLISSRSICVSCSSDLEWPWKDLEPFFSADLRTYTFVPWARDMPC